MEVVSELIFLGGGLAEEREEWKERKEKLRGVKSSVTVSTERMQRLGGRRVLRKETQIQASVSLH